MNIYKFKFIRPHPDKPGYVSVNECVVQAFCYETALQRALLEAHKFAIENNIPYYRVEGDM